MLTGSVMTTRLFGRRHESAREVLNYLNSTQHHSSTTQSYRAVLTGFGDNYASNSADGAKALGSLLKRFCAPSKQNQAYSRWFKLQVNHISPLYQQIRKRMMLTEFVNNHASNFADGAKAPWKSSQDHWRTLDASSYLVVRRVR